MDVPPTEKCCGVFPNRYGSYLISIFGLSTGAVGLTGIILFGLVEKSAMAHLDQVGDETGKKVVLLTIGLISLLLLVSNAMLFIGVSTNSHGAVTASAWVLMFMCLFLIFGLIGIPTICFFYDSYCVAKSISLTLIVLSLLFMNIFLDVWCYFIVIIFNTEMDMY